MTSLLDSKQLRNRSFVVLAAFLASMLAGCSTMEGAGEDIEDAGEEVSEAAEYASN